MKNVRNIIDRSIEWVLVGLMGLMTVNVLWQVATRFVLGDPSSFTEELARFLLIWISVLGAAYLVGKNGHIAIDYIPGKLGPVARQKLQYLIDGMVVLFALLVMIIGGINLVYITLHLGQNSSAMQIPLGWVYAIVPFSGMLILYYILSGSSRQNPDVSQHPVNS